MMVISLDLMMAYHLDLGSTLVCSDLGAINCNPLAYNDETKLGIPLGRSESTEDDTHDGIHDGYPDSILLGAEPGAVVGDILGSERVLIESYLGITVGILWNLLRLLPRPEHGTIYGISLGSNDDANLGILLSTAEGTKNSTKDGVINEYLYGILDGILVILSTVMSTV